MLVETEFLGESLARTLPSEPSSVTILNSSLLFHDPILSDEQAAAIEFDTDARKLIVVGLGCRMSSRGHPGEIHTAVTPRARITILPSPAQT
jgi:hypothetical protein